MSYDKVIDSAQLEADLTTVADAIRAKKETTEPLAFPGGYKSAIESIETGVNTSDATATASDIARNKTAYVNGEKIIGNVTDIKSNATYDLRSKSCYVDEVSYDMGYKSIDLKTKTKEDVLTRNGAIIKTVVMPYRFGNATAADVAKGKTFTSIAGLKVTGTYEPPVSAGGVSF